MVNRASQMKKIVINLSTNKIILKNKEIVINLLFTIHLLEPSLSTFMTAPTTVLDQYTTDFNQENMDNLCFAESPSTSDPVAIGKLREIQNMVVNHVCDGKGDELPFRRVGYYKPESGIGNLEPTGQPSLKRMPGGIRRIVFEGKPVWDTDGVAAGTKIKVEVFKNYEPYLYDTSETDRYLENRPAY